MFPERWTDDPIENDPTGESHTWKQEDWTQNIGVLTTPTNSYKPQRTDS